MPDNSPLTPKRSGAAASEAIVGLWAVALAAFVVATLYFTRDILIPLALSILLTFLLTPLVTRLERWIGRVAAVLTVVVLIFSFTGIMGWILTRQVVEFAGKLPDYKGNIQTKLRSFKMPAGGPFSKLSETLEDLKKDLPGIGADPPAKHAPANPGSEGLLASQTAQPVAVRVIGAEGPGLMATVESIIAPLIGPLGVAALVLVLVISMLIQREDLRSRLIRLLGQGRISATTRALDDAGARVSRYLLMQLFVNVCYGVPIAIGLYFIGVPNALLWGALAMLFRFIPFVGPWIATILPTVLAMAVSSGWGMPLMTVGLFIGLELFLNNVIEPLLYGSSTGVSSIALIVAAVFWTWLWGPIGLVLATPLTVCLVVMGRHVPRLRFLSIILSDEQALTPAEECYQRLLAFDLNETGGLIDTFVRKNSLTALYDSVLIPVVTAAEVDYQRELLTEEQRLSVEESIGAFIDDLQTRPAPPSQIPADQQVAEQAPLTAAPAWQIRCVPVRAVRDELAGGMLMHLLHEQGFEGENLSSKQVTGEMVKTVAEANVDAVCVSVMPPSTVIHARYLCSKLRAQMRDLKIVVGLWGATENLAEAAQRLRDAGADEVVTTLADAVVQLAKLAPRSDVFLTPMPVPDEGGTTSKVVAL